MLVLFLETFAIHEGFQLGFDGVVHHRLCVVVAVNNMTTIFLNAEHTFLD